MKALSLETLALLEGGEPAAPQPRSISKDQFIGFIHNEIPVKEHGFLNGRISKRIPLDDEFKFTYTNSGLRAVSVLAATVWLAERLVCVEKFRLPINLWIRDSVSVSIQSNAYERWIVGDLPPIGFWDWVA